METDQLLDLFNVASDGVEGVPNLAEEAKKNAGITEDDAVDVTGEVRLGGTRHVTDDMVALWDERQYEEEYDLDSFLKNMKG
jgi:TATA-binding protein-associated factor